MRVVKSVCGMCGADNCGLDVYLEGDRIVDIKGMREFPMNRGRLCPQAKAAIEQTYDPKRLRTPLKRVGESWQRISWDQALDTIAEKLGGIKASHGAQALGVYQGRALLQFIGGGWPQRFMNLYGTPNLVRNEHMCAVPNAMGQRLTYGSSSVFYSFDEAHTRCFLLWGSNPITSHLPMEWPVIQAARKRGAKLIVVDPRQTRPAALADIHAPIRPGTDLALALGLIHCIIKHGFHDGEFVRDWTVGFDALAERVAAYPPKRVAEITGLPAEMIERIAENYATIKPAFLDAGNALEHHANSGQTTRAVMLLRVLTGNLDVPGGHLMPQRIQLNNPRLAHKRVPGARMLTAHRHPLLADLHGFVPGDSLIESLLEGTPYPLKAMIMGGGNPMLTWPNTTVMREALERLDLLVVMDLYMTKTAELADIVLPAADPFERTQLIVRSGFFGPDTPMSYLMLRQQLKDPGERRSDWWFWQQLALRMGYGEYYPWQDVKEAIDYRLQPTGISVQDLEENPSGLYHGERPRYRKYEQDGFNTPSGKVEFYSHVLHAYGHDPLPDYTEPAESPVSRPELALEYPLILNAGRRVAVYTHSRHRSLASLRAKEPVPTAELHSETAAACGVSHGDSIIVENHRGAIQVEARATEKIRPGVVSVLHGWGEANVNLLTDHADCDPISAAPALRSGLCRVRKAEPESDGVGGSP